MIPMLKDWVTNGNVSCILLSKNEVTQLIQQIEDLEEKVTISNDLALLLTRFGYQSPNLPFKAPNPCAACATNPDNGGNGVCYCTLGNKVTY